MEPVEELLRQAENLPPLPDMQLRILSSLNDPDADNHDIARLLGYDAILAGRIIRIANSAIFGATQRIESVDAAVVRLGTEGVRDALLTVAVMNAFPPTSTAFDAREFWGLGLASALSARRIAKDLRYSNPDEAYLAGLVHCVGEAVLAVHFRERYERALDDMRRNGCSLAQAVRAEFDVAQPALCARVLEEWRFPKAIVEAVEYHLDPRDAPNHVILASIVFAADRIARELGMGSEEPGHAGGAWVEKIPNEVVELLVDAGYPEFDAYIGVQKEALRDVSELVGTLFLAH